MTGRTGRIPPVPRHPRRSRTAAGSSTAGSAVPPSPAHSVRRLRLAVFSDAIPGRNGVATYYDDLIHHLAPLMNGVVLVSPPAGPPGSTGRFSLSMPGDPTQRIYLPETRRVWREMGELSPDVVISATPGPFGALGMAVAVRRGAGFCVAFHTQLDALADLYWEQLGGRALRTGIRLWDRVMFRCASEVVVHNEALVGAVRERGAATARVMGTAAGRAFIAGSPPPIGTTVQSVAFIGRLAPEKEIGQVWEAARGFPDIRFRFAGDGPLRATVEGWAREAPNVESLGWLRRAEVLGLLDSSDVLVLPSSHETFGSIALEAMARGRIPIVSPNCGISRWPELAPGLVVMDEGERAAGALGRVMGMPAQARAELSRAGRRAARELTEQTVREWAEVIGRTARSRRSP